MTVQRLYLNARYAGRPITGVERYAGEIAARLPGLIPIAPRRPLRGAAGHLWEQIALPRLARDGLLWSPANTGPLAHPRHVLTIHDLAPLDHPEWYARGFARGYAKLWPRLVRRAAALIVPSEFTRQRIVERFGVRGEDVHVVPAGVDAGMFYPRPPDEVRAVRARLGLPERYLLFTGSVQPRKNLTALLGVWRTVVETQAGWGLMIAGEAGGPFAPVELAPAAAVVFTGRVAEQDLPALYSGARGFIQPSLYEGAGLTVLEAMACGCPVAAAGNTALPEYVGEGSVLFDPHDAAALRGAVEGLMAEERSGAVGVERARLFGWERSARLVWDVLLAVGNGIKENLG